ncbi:hypothetical protein [Pseudonocardia sp. ICBG162]|uniref:hypothetical protein n=1 Tax=Pseudonocardia sp. ICBG162 TaxID=2846761 RepID=UPI001CF6E7DC|nr:hypothetical protein [Pseudonocardia sp. ICBG162]
MSVTPASTRPVAVATAPQEPTVTVTCAGDNRSHVVAQAVLSDSLAAGTGHCTALCGHVVLPASLASPPGDGCLLCAETSGAGRRARRRGRIGFGRSARAAS